jgi:chemotaxis protein MotB
VSLNSGIHRSHPGSSLLLGQLTTLEEELEEAGGSHHAALTGNTRWLIPYADILTLLLGFFLVLYSMQNARKHFSQTMHDALQNQTKQQAALIKSQEAELTSLEAELNKLKREADTSAITQSAPDEEAMAYLHTTLDAALQESHALEITQEARGIVISLREGVLFAPGQAELSPAAQKTLDGVAVALKQLNRPIRVEGHTDNTPIKTAQFPSNWELSTARATHIVKYLATHHQMTPDQLSAAGYGEYKPVADNSTVEGKQKNRRVDIVVLNPPVVQEATSQESGSQEEGSQATEASPRDPGRPSAPTAAGPAPQAQARSPQEKPVAPVAPTTAEAAASHGPSH